MTTLNDLRLRTLALEQFEHEKRLRQLNFANYQAWVADGGKDKEQESAEIERMLNKDKYKTNNGLTVYGLRQAGVTVKITHIRYAKIEGVAGLVPTPSYLRGMFEFTPRGGATHVTLTKGEKWWGLSSVCHEDDSFDYKLGVKIALNQLSLEEAADLLLVEEDSAEVLPTDAGLQLA